MFPRWILAGVIVGACWRRITARRRTSQALDGKDKEVERGEYVQHTILEQGVLTEVTACPTFENEAQCRGGFENLEVDIADGSVLSHVSHDCESRHVSGSESAPREEFMSMHPDDETVNAKTEAGTPTAVGDFLDDASESDDGEEEAGKSGCPQDMSQTIGVFGSSAAQSDGNVGCGTGDGCTMPEVVREPAEASKRPVESPRSAEAPITTATKIYQDVDKEIGVSQAAPRKDRSPGTEGPETRSQQVNEHAIMHKGELRDESPQVEGQAPDEEERPSQQLEGARASSQPVAKREGEKKPASPPSAHKVLRPRVSPPLVKLGLVVPSPLEYQRPGLAGLLNDDVDSQNSAYGVRLWMVTPSMAAQL